MLNCKKIRVKDEWDEDSTDSNNNGNNCLPNKDPFSTEILTKIMNKLPTKDLLSCRLVDSNWSDVSTSTVLERKLWIRFKFSEVFQSYYRLEQHLSKTKSLKALTQLIKSSSTTSTSPSSSSSSLEPSKTNKRSFPCTNFYFEDGTLDSPEFQHFLFVFGSKIQSIILGGTIMNNVRIRVFGKLLTSQATNLEFLEVPFPPHWINTPNIPLILPQNSILPALKVAQLYFDEYYEGWNRIANELKAAAVNIRCFRSRRNLKWYRPSNDAQKKLFESAKEDFLCFLTVNKNGVKARKSYGRWAVEMGNEVGIDFIKMGFDSYGEFLYHLDDIIILRTNGEEDYIFLRNGAEGEDLSHITSLVQRTPNGRSNYKGFLATLNNTQYAPFENLLNINYNLTVPVNPQQQQHSSHRNKRKRGSSFKGKQFQGMFGW